MKTIFLVSGLSICMFLFIPVPSSSLAQELVLDSLIAEALRVNPDIGAAKLRYEAFEVRVPQAGSLPDPMFGTTFSNLSAKSWSYGKAPMSGVEYMFSQTIPFPGKLGLAKKSTKSMAQKSKQDYESARNFVVSQLKQSYYQLCWIDKSIEFTQQNKLLIQDFAHIAQTRYSVGEGIQQDVLKAQVEVSQMIDELLMLEEMRRTAQAKINTWLNRNPQETLGEPNPLEFQKLVYTEEELQDLAMQHNPELKGMEFMIKASEAEYRMARREYLPDFTFGLAYMRMQDDANMNPNAERGFVSPSVSLSLPLYFWSKQSKKVQEKELDFKVTQIEYERMKTILKFEVSEKFYSLERLVKKIELYRTVILPQAQASLESARSAYQVNQVDFMTLLENQMTVFNYQIAYHRALAAYYSTIAQLEETVGTLLSYEGE